MNTTTHEMNAISINDIINKDGRAGELFAEITAATENLDSIDELIALENKLNELEATQPEYKYIATMREYIEEAKRFIDNENCRDDLEAIFRMKGADDYTAETAADNVISAWHMQD